MAEVMSSEVLIVSIWMENINPKTLEAHKSVMDIMNNGQYMAVYAKTKLTHGQTMDQIWRNPALAGYKVIMFLDIDAIPLTKNTLKFIIDGALEGALVGNIQSSNHINEGKHVFVAPSCVAMSRETYNKLGKPTAEPIVNRGDVGEEYTWQASEKGIKITFLVPLLWDRPVNRMAWETDRSPTWKLPGGGEYGLGTTFGAPFADSMVWHSFQSFHPGSQEAFWEKCAQVVKENS